MKFTHRKNMDISIKKVWSDDKEICFGIVGTVGMLLHYGILEYCDYDRDIYCFIPAPGIMYKPRFGKTRDEALEDIIKAGF